MTKKFKIFLELALPVYVFAVCLSIVGVLINVYELLGIAIFVSFMVTVFAALPIAMEEGE